MTFDREALESALTATAEHASELKQQLQSAERLRKLLEGLSESVQDRPALGCVLLDKEEAFIADLPDESVRALLRSIAADCVQRREDTSRDVVKSLPDALTQLGLSLDDSSRHPRYTVDERLIGIDVDTRKHIATIRPRHGEAVREPLDPAAVAQRVQVERARLLDRPFDIAGFLKTFKAAHAALSKPKKGAPPNTVMVKDLAVQMAKPGKPRLDEFAVDLGRLLASPSGESLVASHTRDTERGLLLYGLEHGGYVGSVDLRRTAT